MADKYNSSSYDYLIKLLLIGDTGSGKSSLLSRHCDDEFKSTYISTIGVDFKIKTILKNDKMVKMQIWDTAGQERFRTITTSYYRGADGVLIVFDITDRQSFDSLKSWHEECMRFCKKDSKIIIIGNKLDLDANRKVTYNEASEYAKSIGTEYIETSAKTANNVEKAFDVLLDLILDKINYQLDKNKKNDNILVLPSEHKKTGNCC